MSENSRQFFLSELERTKLRADMYEFLRECLELKTQEVCPLGDQNLQETKA